MKIEKLNLKAIKNVLRRAELKTIMAGSNGNCQNLSGCTGSGGSCDSGCYCIYVGFPDGSGDYYCIS